MLPQGSGAATRPQIYTPPRSRSPSDRHTTRQLRAPHQPQPSKVTTPETVTPPPTPPPGRRSLPLPSATASCDGPAGPVRRIDWGAFGLAVPARAETACAKSVTRAPADISPSSSPRFQLAGRGQFSGIEAEQGADLDHPTKALADKADALVQPAIEALAALHDAAGTADSPADSHAAKEAFRKRLVQTRARLHRIRRAAVQRLALPLVDPKAAALANIDILAVRLAKRFLGDYLETLGATF